MAKWTDHIWRGWARWGAALAVLGALGGAASAREIVIDLPQERLKAADVVILGEVHDNALHHLGQAEILRGLTPRAVVFEMLTPEMAAEAEAGRGDLDTLGARIGWEAAGWPDFDIYRPVFEALGEAGIVGAALPRGDVRAAFSEGAAAVFGDQAGRFGLTAALPEAELEARKQMQFAAHCEAMPLEMMGGMVEAQRLRDAAFARAALEALERFGPPVAVITGHGHARRDWGMPALMAQAAPEVRVLSVGFVERPVADEDARFDHRIVTDAAERGDPCAAFQN